MRVQVSLALFVGSAAALYISAVPKKDTTRYIHESETHIDPLCMFPRASFPEVKCPDDHTSTPEPTIRLQTWTVGDITYIIVAPETEGGTTISTSWTPLEFEPWATAPQAQGGESIHWRTPPHSPTITTEHKSTHHTFPPAATEFMAAAAHAQITARAEAGAERPAAVSVNANTLNNDDYDEEVLMEPEDSGVLEYNPNDPNEAQRQSSPLPVLHGEEDVVNLDMGRDVCPSPSPYPFGCHNGTFWDGFQDMNCDQFSISFGVHKRDHVLLSGYDFRLQERVRCPGDRWKRMGESPLGFPVDVRSGRQCHDEGKDSSGGGFMFTYGGGQIVDVDTDRRCRLLCPDNGAVSCILDRQP